MAAETLVANNTVGLGSWSGSWTDIDDTIAAADDDTTKITAAKMSAPTTATFDLTNLAVLTNVNSTIVKVRAKYDDAGGADLTCRVKNGGSTVASVTASVGTAWTTYTGTEVTDSYTSASVNAWTLEVEFTSGSGMGVNTLHVTAVDVLVDYTGIADFFIDLTSQQAAALAAMLAAHAARRRTSIAGQWRYGNVPPDDVVVVDELHHIRSLPIDAWAGA